MKNVILLTLILICLSCNKNTKEEQKPLKQEEQKPIKQEEQKPVTSYVIIIYKVSYYELIPISDEYSHPDLQMKELISEIKEVEDLNDEKKAKLKDKFLIKVNKRLKTKNDEYFEDIAELERKNNINRTYNSPYTMKKSKIKEFKDRKTEIYERTIKVFDTYKEASDFRFKFNQL